MTDTAMNTVSDERLAFYDWWVGSGRRDQYDVLAEQAAYTAWMQCAPLRASIPGGVGVKVDDLAQEIRRVDGDNSLGAGRLAEALLPFLSALHLSPAEPPANSPTVIIGYTNWRGEYAEREIVPMRPWFGSTDWHPEPQWLLKAWDVAKDAERDFALKDIGFAAPSNPVISDEMVERVAKAMHHCRDKETSWWVPWAETQESYRNSSRSMVRTGLAALSVKPQNGENG